MKRTRAAVLAAAAATALSGAIVPLAQAGSHWSTAKCNKTYLRFYRQHTGADGSVSRKQSREIAAYQRKLERQHRCHLAG